MEKFKIKKIVVPVDFSETAINALKEAVLLAKVCGAHIQILHVVDIVEDIYKPADAALHYDNAMNKTMVKKSTLELKKMVKNFKEADVLNMDYEVKSGNINDAICQAVEEGAFDLVVMGTHGTSGVKEFFSGSNAYKVVRNASCPVLTIQKNSAPTNFKNIILPIRLEKSSRQKVDYVVDLARLFDATVFITGYTNEKDEAKQFKIKQYVAQVERYLEKLGVKYKSKLIFAPNFIKEIIKHALKNKAGLLVVMKEHDFSLDQLVKGVYAEQFANHSPIPVLSIPVAFNPQLVDYAPPASVVPF